MLEDVYVGCDTPESPQTKPCAEENSYVKILTDDFSLETAEREFILRALGETGWQRIKAAALFGITHATLHSKLKRYSLTDQELDSSRECVPAGGRAVAV